MNKKEGFLLYKCNSSNSSSSSWSHAEDYKWYNDADLNFALIDKMAIDLPTTKMLKHKTKSIKTLSKNTW